MMLEQLLDLPLTTRLGWTLVHSLWQGVVLAATVAVALRFLWRGRSSVRYAVACLAMLLWLAVPVSTFFLISPTPTSTAGSDAFAVTAKTSGTEQDSTEPTQTSTERSDGWITFANDLKGTSMLVLPIMHRVLPYLAIAWLIIASLLSLRLLGGTLLVKGLARSGEPSSDLQSRSDAIASRLGIRRKVRLQVSRQGDSPLALGWLRPVVVLPASAVTGLTTAQLELILAHELAHIRRGDYLQNVLQGLCEALLFYHPLTWWLSATIRKEREHACDDLALSATMQKPVALAEALATLEIHRPAPLPALGANNNLVQRVRRLLGRPPVKSPNYTLAAAALAGSLLVTVSFAALGQGAMGDEEPDGKEHSWRHSVVIDPSHSDKFPGAKGPIAEADLTLAVALMVRELLEEKGIRVLLTREDGEALSETYRGDLEARASLASPEHRAFVSLHANASNRLSTEGIETWVATRRANTGGDHRTNSRVLGNALQTHLIASTSARDRSVKYRDLFLLRLARTPAASVDLGFLSNPEEAALLASEAYQARLARGLANGIVAYLEEAALIEPSAEVEGVPTGTDGGYEQIVVTQLAQRSLPEGSLVIPFPGQSD